MMAGQAAAIPVGGVCAFQLPPDQSGAGLARSLLAGTMAGLNLAPELIETGKLAASELVTNSHQHAGSAGRYEPVTAPEMWVWARTDPALQLVVSVFDADRHHMPHSRSADLMDEHGRGLGIVAAVSADWGAHLSRCRLAPWPVSGKSVWFALPLPGPWPPPSDIRPSVAAHRLLMVLGSRGVEGIRSSDRRGLSVVTVDNLTILVEPKSFSWNDGTNHVRLPIADLQETAERVVRHLEEPAQMPDR